MKKPRTILELLKLMLNHIKKAKDFSGMCITICDMQTFIPYEEASLIREYLNNNKTAYSRQRPDGYWWKQGVKSYRIKWLKNQIKKLES